LHDAVPAPLFKNRALNKALPPVGKKANYAFAKTKLKDRRTVVSRRGITLLFNSSEAIRATLDGKVSFVGKLPGLEEAVIIEHSAGLRSVYALLRAIPLKVGQQIVAGDLVGFAAIDPLRKRFALYFELREGIELVDARPLLRARGRP
jgi:septal ring factor EnvC (AmiA/AmiB activator)